MNLKIYKNLNNKFEFSVVYAETDIFKSSDEIFPFIGEYGEYESLKEAEDAGKRCFFTNFDFLTKIAETESSEQIESIKSNIISRYSKGVQQFIDMIDRIDVNEKDMLKQRVESLKSIVDQYKDSIMETIKTFENQKRDKGIEKEDVQQIGYHEFKSPFAKQLFILKKRLKKFYRKLRKKFGNYLDIAKSGVLTKILTAGDDSWIKQVLFEFGDNAAGSLKFSNSRTSGIELSREGFDVCISCDDGSIVLSFGNNMILRGIHPLKNFLTSHPHMSQKYYNDIWLPIFTAVGHYAIDENHIIFPETDNDIKIGFTDDGKYLKSKFKGFDIRDNNEIYANVYLVGETSPENKTCIFATSEISGRENKVFSDLEKAKKELSEVQMVKCINSGTKYDNIAGKVIKEDIIERNGYLEIPIKFTFDNGNEETVFMTSDMLEKFL